MPRYLTPAKVCLLVLIDLYVSGEIPNSAKLGVLSFISSQIVNASDYNIAGLEERFKISSASVIALDEVLSQWQSGVPGRNLYDLLLQRLWELDGIDSLHALFEHLGELMTSVAVDSQEANVPRLSRSSPLGQLLRRSDIEFTRLQFADSMALWDTIVAFRQPSYDSWASRHPNAAYQREADEVPWMKAHLRSVDASAQSSYDFTSVEDSHTLLSFSVQRLQKLGARVPQDVKTKLERWIQEQSESGSQSLQFFMAFFEHWRAGEHSMAEESLRRYFDYSLNKQSVSENVKVYYQYAYLHLSVLHADFECWGRSVEMMAECIASARENQDTACLNFALSWLLYLRQAHPNENPEWLQNLQNLVGGGGGDQDEITFLKTKAREGKHWSLMSSTLLEEAKLEMYSGGSSSKAFEHILQSSYLNTQHDIRTLMTAATLFQGAGYERLGQASLGFRMFESVKLIYGLHCPLSDRVRAATRVAYTLAHAGLYQAGMEALEDVDPEAKGVLKLQQRVQAFKTLVQLKKHFHSEDFKTANGLLESLKCAQSSSDPELSIELANLEAELLIKETKYQQARHKVNAQIKTLKESQTADIAQQLHLLVMKCRIFAVGGQAAKGFSLATRAVSTAERLRLVPVLVEALAALAVILNDLSEFDAARDLLEAALPLALETRDTYLAAQMFSSLADAHVGIAGYACNDERTEQARNMRIAGANVERGYEAYRKLGDLTGMLDCLTMKSQLARWNNDDLSATQPDQKHIQLLEEKVKLG